MRKWISLLALTANCCCLADANSDKVDLRLELVPKQDVYYVGQPVKLRITMNAEYEYEGLNLNGLPPADILHRSDFHQEPNAKSGSGIVFVSDIAFLKSGTVRFAPFLTGNIIEHRRSGFFIASQRSPFSAASTPFSVEVRGIPTQGRPDDFLGVIGDFRLLAELDSKECSLGDLVTIKWRLVGQGAFGNIEHINYNPGTGFKVYPTRQVAKTDDMISFSNVIIPLNTNVTQVAPFSVTVFNPITGRFETISAGPFALSVKEKAAVTNNIADFRPMTDAAGVAAETSSDRDADKFFNKMFRRNKEYVIMNVSAKAGLAPDSHSKILFEIPKGAKVEVREKSGDYLRVMHNEFSGWIGRWVTSEIE